MPFKSQKQRDWEKETPKGSKLPKKVKKKTTGRRKKKTTKRKK